MENTPMREEHERLLERCRENPLVMEAQKKILDSCGDLLWAMLQALAEMEDEDNVDQRTESQDLYTDAEWNAYMLPYYEELMEQQKRRARRDKLETAASVALTVVACLLLIGYCVARIVL